MERGFEYIAKNGCPKIKELKSSCPENCIFFKDNKCLAITAGIKNIKRFCVGVVKNTKTSKIEEDNITNEE